MRLTDLRGLWLIMSVPLLILIYFLLRRHRDTAVGSTYIWRLSDKHLKRRTPVRTFYAGAAFFMQLAVLCLCALGALSPVVSTGRDRSLTIILDVSGSMQTVSDGGSRFDRAVDSAHKLIRTSGARSVTVIAAGDEPCCVVTGGTPAKARDALGSLSCGWGSCDLTAAARLAGAVNRDSAAGRTVIYTDVDISSVQNAEVTDMRAGEIDYAASCLSQTAGGFCGTVTSYGEDRWLSVRLYLDGNEAGVQSVFCRDGVPETVVFDVGSPDFSLASMSVSSGRPDGIAADDTCCLIGRSRSSVSVLVAGQDTVFFEDAPAALGGCRVTVTDEYRAAFDGRYDLYILCGGLPADDKMLPKGGLSLLFADASEELVEGARLVGLPVSTRTRGDALSYVGDDPLFAGTEELLGRVSVGRQVYPELLGGWTALSCFVSSASESSLVRVTDEGNRQYLFLFGTRDSNLSLTPAFLILLDNAMNMAAKMPVGRTSYRVGETVVPDLPDGVGSFSVRCPDGSEAVLAPSGAGFVPRMPGLHTLTFEQDGTQDELPFVVTIPESEYASVFEGDVILPAARDDAASDTSAVPFICAAAMLLLLIEWGYLCRGHD